MRLPGSALRSAWNGLSVSFYSIALIAITSTQVAAQNVPYQRAFPQSKTVVEKRLKEMQSSSAGHLPVLEGFTIPGDRPLDRFHRGYYQCAVQVTSTPSGGSMVRVAATITAWYTDPASSRSGYQVLPSNGRLESDFLDRLQQALGGAGSSAGITTVAKPQPVPAGSQAPAPALSAPLPGNGTPIVHSNTSGSPFKLGGPLRPDNLPSIATQKAIVDRHAEEESKEAKGLEEILSNQAHPTNLAAVKKADTPVLAKPIEDAKVLFLAAAEDEFEILDANPNWVHVRISGLSRGWIRRSSLEMPEVDPDAAPAEAETPKQPGSAESQPFHVSNEQVASFPGTWAPLMGRTVTIVSVQNAANASATGADAKVKFARSLLNREYDDLIKTPTSIMGVVIIFDSEDGGMVAATLPELRQWKSGALSDEGFWRRCFFDPPEAFSMDAGQ